MNRNKQRGVSLVEYALLIALIATLALGAMTAVGHNISTQFSSLSSYLE